MVIRVLIADDHSVVREGLRMFLGRDPEFAVVGEAADGEEAVRLSARTASRRDPDGPAHASDGRDCGYLDHSQRTPETEVIALTSVLESAVSGWRGRAGAIGYLLKDTRAPELRSVIKAAAAGQVQLSPQASAYLMREVRTSQSQRH